jgi:hypothetical protein
MVDDFPLELLLEIFSYLAADRPNAARTHSRTNFTFTHVCRYWREAALAEPRLWTRIYVMSPARECVETMVVRSRDLPLLVATDVHGAPYLPRWTTRLVIKQPSIPSFDVALNQLHRIVDLEIAPRRWMECFKPENDVAPMLKRLHIDAPDHEISWLPLDFLKDGAPKLEILELICYNQHWTWKSNHFSHLKHLSVHARQGASSRAVGEDGFDDLLETLAYSPHLETVSLLNVIPGMREAPRNRKPVCLSRLRKLNLKGSADRISAVVDALSFPLDTKCSYYLTSSGQEGLVFVHKLLSPFIGRLRRSALRTTDNYDHWTAYEEDQSDAIVELQYCWSTSFPTSIPSAFWNVDVLTLRCSSICIRTALSATNDRLPLVPVLRIEGARNCMQFIRAFGKLPELAFPVLRELELPDLDEWWHPDIGDRRTEIISKLIIKALEARHVQGHRLIILRIPCELSGPWTQVVLDAQLVESIEVI